jgi:hypothetical protein
VTKALRVGNSELTSALTSGLAYIRANQAADGSFAGLSGAYQPGKPFNPKRASPTIFATSLILNCLSTVPNSKVLRRAAAKFLLSQRSNDWRWNYWIRDSSMARTHPYPDDLDDIACSLAALTQYDHTLIDGTVLGHLAQTLISTEVRPSGPYRTWLHADWETVDLAVNANIGYLLHLHDVALPGLNTYIAQSIAQQDLTSEFYVGCIPVLYFITRWYTGDQAAELRQRVIDEIDMLNNQPGTPNALSLALLIRSGIRVGVSHEFIYPLVKRLIQLQKRGSWAAQALYRDPHIKGVDLYAGSRVLTTAFALEALRSYQMYVRIDIVRETTRRPTLPVPKSHRTVQSSVPLLAAAYERYKQKFLASNGIDEITQIATLTAQACGKKLPQKTLDSLNSASIDGWISYSIYDNFLDGNAHPELLGVANYAVRNMLESFRTAVPDAGFQRLTQATLDTMDQANTWEVTQARARIDKNKVYIDKLPDYEDLSQLAHKSLGHLLASCGILVLLGYSTDSPEMRHFQEFFFHFLIARQLSDDAHDWQEDLLAGRITPVVSMLIDTTPMTIAEKDIEKLLLRFWQTTITEITALIHFQTGQARSALARCTFLQSTAVFKDWLAHLDTVATKAESGSAEAQKFIDAFGAPSDMNDTV